MSRSELQPFIDAAKKRGIADEFLADLLTGRGWPSADVHNGIADWWERATGVSVPARRGSSENARDAFLYLLAFSTLATWASAFGSLWFHLIEYWLPDVVVNPSFSNFRSIVTWQMAAILVAFPVYLYVMRVIQGETRANPDRIESDVRKWLTYIALLAAAIGVVSGLVWFVDYFLKGGLTLRFVLKSVTVLAICGSIFCYYLGFLRGGARNRTFAILSVAGVAPALYFGLAVTGTPAMQRQFEADNRRVQDLRTIATAFSGMTTLPSSLEVAAAQRPSLPVSDPVTHKAYEYTATSFRDYQLCATFAAADTRSGRGGGFWSHPKGRACFAFATGHPVPW